MNYSINFFSEDLSFELEQPIAMKEWVEKVVASFDQTINEINYIYCSDNYLLNINQEYLEHDYFTDIITFDNRENGTQALEADIFISIDRVQENAKNLEIPFMHELSRVMIHGIHHLLGQGDKTEAQKIEMREKEEASLSLLKF